MLRQERANPLPRDAHSFAIKMTILISCAAQARWLAFLSGFTTICPKIRDHLRKALARISLRCVLPGQRQRVFCRPTDGHRLLNLMNRRFSIPLGEVRKTGSSASRIELSGYASFQYHRFLKAAAGQASIAQMHHCVHLAWV